MNERGTAHSAQFAEDGRTIAPADAPLRTGVRSLPPVPPPGEAEVHPRAGNDPRCRAAQGGSLRARAINRRPQTPGPQGKPGDGLPDAQPPPGRGDPEAGVLRQQAVLLRGDRRTPRARLFDMRYDREGDRIRQRKATAATRRDM